jgi:hypothetical protein
MSVAEARTKVESLGAGRFHSMETGCVTLKHPASMPLAE